MHTTNNVVLMRVCYSAVAMVEEMSMHVTSRPVLCPLSPVLRAPNSPSLAHSVARKCCSPQQGTTCFSNRTVLAADTAVILSHCMAAENPLTPLLYVQSVDHAVSQPVSQPPCTRHPELFSGRWNPITHTCNQQPPIRATTTAQRIARCCGGRKGSHRRQHALVGFHSLLARNTSAHSEPLTLLARGLDC